MKKQILTTFIALIGLITLKAQSVGFEAGGFVGFPIGDASSITSFNFGVNAAYYWKAGGNLQAGFTSGYDHWTGKDVKEIMLGGPPREYKTEDFGFIPLAITTKYEMNKFFGGLDIGYAVYIGKKGGEGGFYYKPRVGYTISSFNIYGFYKGISNNGSSINTLGFGFGYKF